MAIPPPTADPGRPGLRALERELGAPPPPGVAELPDDDLALLAAALRDAGRRQERALAAAGDAAVGQIPAVLRRLLRALLGARG